MMINNIVLQIIAIGEVRGDEDLPRRSPAMNIPMYTDTAAIALVNAVDIAIRSYKKNVDGGRLSLVVITEFGCAEVLADYRKNCELGFVSPARYTVASPAAMTGLPCIVFSIQGPTLTLTSPVSQSLPLALMMSGVWLQRSLVDAAIIARADRGAARCMVLSSNFIASKPEAFSLDSAMAWLAQPLAGC